MSVAIRIKPGTRDFLKDISMKGETYDDVINRLILRHAEARDAINDLETTIAELKDAEKAKAAWIKACEEAEA